MAKKAKSAPNVTVDRSKQELIPTDVKFHTASLQIYCSDPAETKANLVKALPAYLAAVMGLENFSRLFSGFEQMAEFVDRLAEAIIERSVACGEVAIVDESIKFMNRPSRTPEMTRFVIEVMKDVRLVPKGDHHSHGKHAKAAAGQIWRSMQNFFLSKERQEEIFRREQEESARRNATTGQRG